MSLQRTNPDRTGERTVGDDSLSSDYRSLHHPPVVGSRTECRAQPCMLFVPNLYISGETQCPLGSPPRATPSSAHPLTLRFSHSPS